MVMADDEALKKNRLATEYYEPVPTDYDISLLQK